MQAWQRDTKRHSGIPQRGMRQRGRSVGSSLDLWASEPASAACVRGCRLDMAHDLIGLPGPNVMVLVPTVNPLCTVMPSNPLPSLIVQSTRRPPAGAYTNAPVRTCPGGQIIQVRSHNIPGERGGLFGGHHVGELDAHRILVAAADPTWSYSTLTSRRRYQSIFAWLISER